MVDPSPNETDKVILLEERVKSLEKELALTREKYQHIYDNAPSGVYEVDFVNQKFVSCNDELLKYTGYTRDEFFSLDSLDILTDESKVMFLERMQELFAGNEVENDPVYQVLRKDGSSIWAKLNPTYIYKDGNLVGAHVIVHDISELRKVEKEAQDATDMFQMVFKNAQELIVVLQDGEIKFINDMAILTGGFKDDDLVNTSFLDLIHPDDQQESIERYLKRMAGEDVPDTNLVRISTAAGEYRWTEIKSILIDWKDKPATINFLTDITDRVQAEKELKETEDKYRLVVENSKESIVITQQGKMKFMNDRTAEILGYKVNDLEDRSFLDWVHPDDRQMALDKYSARMRGEEVSPTDVYRLLHKDGIPVYGEVNSVIIDWEGSPAVLSFISDVTKEQLSKKMAQEEKSKSEFYLDLLGHDIGNLMQGISAWMEMARKTEIPEGRLKMCLDQSWHLSERSKRLVKNVLIISKIRDKEPQLQSIELLPILNRTAKEAENTFPDKEVLLEIGSNDHDPRIMAEPIIEEMFYNLVHNAIKFQTHDRPRVRIEILECLEDRVKMSISDRGPGILDAQKSGIFRRFKDITGKKSTGIGLALTKELVDRYNGSIMVEDNMEGEEVVGAKFTIELPTAGP